MVAEAVHMTINSLGMPWSPIQQKKQQKKKANGRNRINMMDYSTTDVHEGSVFPVFSDSESYWLMCAP